MHSEFAINLFKYLKKKASNQIKNRGFSSKSKWSFLILMLKTAKNICKLSDNSMKIDIFFKNSDSTIVNFNKINKKLIKIDKNVNSLQNPQKKTNMYEGIRELSEFVMTKTKDNEGIIEENPLKKRDMGYMTPKEALKFSFTVKKPQN